MEEAEEDDPSGGSTSMGARRGVGGESSLEFESGGVGAKGCSTTSSPFTSISMISPSFRPGE